MSNFLNKLTVKSQKNNRKANRILQAFESLETRQLMAADVAILDAEPVNENLVAEVANDLGVEANQVAEVETNYGPTQRRP